MKNCWIGIKQQSLTRSLLLFQEWFRLENKITENQWKNSWNHLYPPFKWSIFDLFWLCPTTFGNFSPEEYSWKQLINWKNHPCNLHLTWFSLTCFSIFSLHKLTHFFTLDLLYFAKFYLFLESYSSYKSSLSMIISHIPVSSLVIKEFLKCDIRNLALSVIAMATDYSVNLK